MADPDRLPDYPLSSDLAKRLKSALDAGDEDTVSDLICTQVRHVDAVVELANDDWMKHPSAQLPPGVLLGLWTLEYKRELTTPLCIAAARGNAACVSHLLGRGADPNASPGGRGPLHEACLGGHTACAQLLLQRRADPDLLSAEGLAPLHLCRTVASLGSERFEHCYLNRVTCRSSIRQLQIQTVACAPQAAPERTVQALLNHGSPTVWPDAFPKVLKTCASAPAVIEVLVNSYPQLRVSESWKEVIPEDVFQPPKTEFARTRREPPHRDGAPPREVAARCPQRRLLAGRRTRGLRARTDRRLPLQAHQPFYRTLFALARAPRCLQHLCRCAIRKRFGRKCFHLVPLSPVPKSLQNYLLLEPEGVLH
ncbi:Ankyrin repeat and SOCS box-containing protein 18 [Pteropus alecto]|uniref:Ankyrin repeat and SOCS box-containing protein 18 n=1 Tax=Pteropus alecto TaxID=9402 RepID=L5KSE0_PTEAL|nr:Ankyrin repeat and SOCS box-containing protein 18 [Pteropus alecto]